MEVEPGAVRVEAEAAEQAPLHGASMLTTTRAMRTRAGLMRAPVQQRFALLHTPALNTEGTYVNPAPPTPEQKLASRSLEAMASSVSKAMLDFEKWLVAGYGAIFALAVPKVADLSQVIAPANLKWALAALATALVLSVFALFLAAQIVAGNSVREELQKGLPELIGSFDRPVDLDGWAAEQLRGLWWPATTAYRYSMRKLKAGDWTAGGRLVAKLAQAQTFVVFAQILLGLAAVVLTVAGVTLK
jgi:hypothetical protein